MSHGIRFFVVFTTEVCKRPSSHFLSLIVLSLLGCISLASWLASARAYKLNECWRTAVIAAAGEEDQIVVALLSNVMKDAGERFDSIQAFAINRLTVNLGQINRLG